MYMLTKSFKSNKYYEVTRFYFKYGNEWDEMENTVTVWDTYEKAMAYIERYSSGLKFASAQIEVNNLDREITYEDYKKGNYNIVSFQKIYDVTPDGTEDTKPEEIIYMSDKKPADADEQSANEAQEKQEPVYKVSGFNKHCFNSLNKAEKFASKFAARDRCEYTIFEEQGNVAKIIKTIKPPEKILFYKIWEYPATFSNLEAVNSFIKGLGEHGELHIYKVIKKDILNDQYILINTIPANRIIVNAR